MGLNRAILSVLTALVIVSAAPAIAGVSMTVAIHSPSAVSADPIAQVMDRDEASALAILQAAMVIRGGPDS